MQELAFLLVGFFAIIKASDLLVDSASAIAVKCKVPKMLIALTIVSFGTCAPEVAISFNSVMAKNGTMAFANVVGSCIVNVFLIIGLAAIVKQIKVKHNTIKKELQILLNPNLFPSLITISGNNKLNVGETSQLSVSVTPEGADAEVTWS